MSSRMRSKCSCRCGPGQRRRCIRCHIHSLHVPTPFAGSGRFVFRLSTIKICCLFGHITTSPKKNLHTLSHIHTIITYKSLFCTTHSDIVTKISRKFNLFLIFRDLLFARTCYYSVCRTDHLRDVGEVSCSYTPRTPLSYFLQLLRYCLPPMISCKKRKPAPLAGFFSISAENDFGEIFEKIFLDNRKNLGNTYIFTHSVFIDKSVYSCNNEEDEGRFPRRLDVWR